MIDQARFWRTTRCVRRASCHRFRQRVERVAHQDQVGARLRERGAATHRDRDVGAAQQRRVVDAVADRDDHGAPGLQRLQSFELRFRAQP